MSSVSPSLTCSSRTCARLLARLRTILFWLKVSGSASSLKGAAFDDFAQENAQIILEKSQKGVKKSDKKTCKNGENA